MDNQPNEVSLTECRLGVLAVIHYGMQDLTALNQLLDGIQHDARRATAVLLAVLQCVHTTAPELRNPERIKHLRKVVAEMTRRLE